MSLDASLSILSNSCTVVTIVMFATGIPQCVQMVKQKSTKNIPYIPFLMTNINNVAWIAYGHLTQNSTLILVNSVGSCLQTMYMLVYIFYVADKRLSISQTMISVFVLWVTWSAIRYIFSPTEAVSVLGTLCCIITVLMFASPLLEINTVLMMRSTASMSLPLTVTSFLCAGLWTLFGLALGDNFIVIPNILGFSTSVVRFGLFYKFAPIKTKEKLAHLPAVLQTQLLSPTAI